MGSDASANAATAIIAASSNVLHASCGRFLMTCLLSIAKSQTRDCKMSTYAYVLPANLESPAPTARCDGTAGGKEEQKAFSMACAAHERHTAGRPTDRR